MVNTPFPISAHRTRRSRFPEYGSPETGAHLWAENFDGTLEDIFQLQDNVASSVAGVIEPTLQVAEHRRSVQRPTNDLTAYDLFLQARAALYLVSRDGPGVRLSWPSWRSSGTRITGRRLRWPRVAIPIYTHLVGRRI